MAKSQLPRVHLVPFVFLIVSRLTVTIRDWVKVCCLFHTFRPANAPVNDDVWKDIALILTVWVWSVVIALVGIFKFSDMNGLWVIIAVSLFNDVMLWVWEHILRYGQPEPQLQDIVDVVRAYVNSQAARAL